LQSRRNRFAISAQMRALHALIVAFRKAARGMIPCGWRPSVGTSRSIFSHESAQPIHVPQCNVGPWKRRLDSCLVKSIEDGDPQIRAYAMPVVKVDKCIELEFKTVRPELFELRGRRRRRQDIRIVLRYCHQDRPDFAWIAPASHTHRNCDAAEV